MEYRKLGETYYLRFDRGDEIVSGILDLCRAEGIASATFQGIGGCQSAEIQTFDAVAKAFATERIEGMLELVSLMGNVISDESGELAYHAHALFSYIEEGEHRTLGGHLKATTVLYTGEIELHPVLGGRIGSRFDPETGAKFWSFEA